MEVRSMIVLCTFVLDFSRLELRRGERCLKLTPIEMRLLALLGGHLEQWVSRREIHSEVWEDPADIQPYGEDKVDMAIARLRRKLKASGIPLVIRSSRHHGVSATCVREVNASAP
jgi:DNA-binding response OmpR family regulator